MHIFRTTCKNNILFTNLNELQRVPDTVRASGTCRGDGIVHSLNFERSGNAGRHGTGHNLRDAIWAGTLDASVAHDIDGFSEHLARNAA